MKYLYLKQVHKQAGMGTNWSNSGSGRKRQEMVHEKGDEWMEWIKEILINVTII